MRDHDDAGCPACGGSGGGPFGRPGSAWDVETYVCPRCEGLGVVREGMAVARPLAKGRGEPAAATGRPGLVACEPVSLPEAARRSGAQ